MNSPEVIVIIRCVSRCWVPRALTCECVNVGKGERLVLQGSGISIQSNAGSISSFSWVHGPPKLELLMRLHRGRHLKPSLVVQYGEGSTAFVANATKLLQEERHPCPVRLVSQVSRPVDVHWTRLRGRSRLQQSPNGLPRTPATELKSTRSSSGSTDTKRTAAGMRASTVSLGAYFWLSTDVPIHTLAGQPSGNCDL